MRYHFSLIKKEKIRELEEDVGEDVGESQPLCTAGESVNWYSGENCMDVPHKTRTAL